MSKAVLCDANICIGCRSCQLACRQCNGQMGGIGDADLLSARTWTRVRSTELESGGQRRRVFTKLQCMHCQHPACAAACPVGALQKTPGGPVVYDDRKCIGCRYCMVACPFGIPTFEWDEPIPWVRKCTFCADRQAAGLQPACVKACPTGGLKYGERQELLMEARERIAAAPGSYVNHIYGENEVGGTSWLYLSPVPFASLGLPALGTEPVTLNAERAVGSVPPVLFGVAAAMAGIYWIVQRRDRMMKQEASNEGKGDRRNDAE